MKFLTLGRTLSLLTVVAVGIAAAQWLRACPFCTAVSQTLRQEMATMDAVVIAEATTESQRDAETGEVPLRVVSVLKGKDFITPGATVRSVYYGAVQEGSRFMLSGVEPTKLMWSSPLPVDERVEKYLEDILQLPDDEVARLRFFQPYLQDASTMLSRDAYDEFASTPYTAIRQLKDDMDHDQLVQWIKDPELPADRRRLFLVMLGVCGSKDDVSLLETMLRSTQPSARTGLDSLIACYITLGGPDALPLVSELFLANKQAPYADTYAAIMAIRFHGTETDVVPRADLVKALHQVLDRPDLADLVIPDLARWGDWTQIDRLVTLFEQADAENNWIRVPVVNYMRACPLPEAKAAMEKLKQIDPEAVKRANTFFTAPVPPPDTPSSTSSWTPPSSMRNGSDLPRSGGVMPGNRLLAQATLAQATGRIEPPAGGRGKGMVPVVAMAELPSANPLRTLSVLSTAVVTLIIFGYLLISGGPQPRPLMIPARASRPSSRR